MALSLLAPAGAWGHAAFIESQPEPGTRLESGPGEIRLEFTEPLNRPLSEATLRDASIGEDVPAEVVAGEEEKELIVRPKERLGRAAYSVDWQTVSTVDGHTLEGSFSFGVQTTPLETEGNLEQSPLARDGWLRIGARVLLYAALFFFAGGLLNATLLAGRSEPGAWMVPEGLRPLLARAGKDPDTARDEVWTRTLDVGWLALGGAVAAALAEASDAGGGLSAQALSDFLLSNGAGLARVGTVAAVAIALLLARSMRVAASMAVVLAFLTIALSGHANSAEPRSWAVLTDWIHLIAAAIWIGGIAQIALAWLPAIRGLDREARLAVIDSVLSRFGRVALPAFFVVAASGSINALMQLGEVSALWESSYGRVLAAKIVLVGLIALASYGHALRLRPRLAAANPHPGERLERRHWRLLGVEPWLGLGAIIAVAALVAFPLPPSQLGEAGEAEAAAPCDPCPQPKAKPDQLPVAEQAGPWIAAFWLERQGEGLTGTLRLLDNDSKPVDASAELPGGDLSECGTGCWRLAVPSAGDVVTVTVEESGNQYTATVPARWTPERSEQAKRLLARAQGTMRSLDSARMSEDLTSGPGSFVHTGYRFQGRDRFAYRTSSGARAVIVGEDEYDFDKGRWRKSSFGGGTGPFSLTAFFRWSAYAQATRWLGGDGPRVELALFDPATPLWYRLTIERKSGRIVRERMITGGHFMTRRYLAFNQLLEIEPPQ